MADGSTTNLTLRLPEVGASSDTWGTKLNSNWRDVDALFNATPALLVTKGGTGLATFGAAGAIPRSTAATTLAALALGTARQLLQVNAGATDIEWASNISIPGTLSVTGTSTLAAVNTSGIVTGTVSPAATASLRAVTSNNSNGGHITLENTSGTTAFRNWAIATNYNINGALEFMVSASDGAAAIGGTVPLKLLSTGLTAVAGSTPASAAATGVAGTITWDSSFVYICTATNTWKRVAIATW